ALEAGMDNLKKHIETVQHLNLPFVVAINKYPYDKEAEKKFIEDWCDSKGYKVGHTDIFFKGGEGGIDLVDKLVKATKEKQGTVNRIYYLEDSLETKIRKVAQNVYGADDIELSAEAKKQVDFFEKQGWGELPICMAKTQYSLSDNPKLLGRPTG